MVLWLGITFIVSVLLAAKIEIEAPRETPRRFYAILLTWVKFGLLWGLYAFRGPGGLM